MSKRSRQGSESGDSGQGFSLPQPAAKKSKRLLIGGPPALDQARACAEIMDGLRAHKTPEGRLLCEAFLRAPSRRNSPDYYKAVANPIDLMRIQQKVKTEEIQTIDALTQDLNLLVANAKAFYPHDSQEHSDACELLTVLEEVKKRVLTESGAVAPSLPASVAESGSSSRDVSPAPSRGSLRSQGREGTPGRLGVQGADPVHVSVLEEYLASVMELTDEGGTRILCPPFRQLPSKDEFPDYYAAIKDPVDLRSIGERLRQGRYKTLNDIERDLALMCKNAKSFNEPASLIHRDATTLRKFAAKRKAELCETGARPVAQPRQEANQETIEELLRQAQDDDVQEYSEDSDEDEQTEQSKDPRWKVYWTVRNYVDPAQGDACLADPFVQLPDRNWYPDYYDEIKEPMSLFMINKTLKRDGYRHVLALLQDLHRLFENAKLYNIEGSEIHTNACKLQVVANCKARELEPNLNLTGLPVKLPPHLAHLGSINATNPPPPPAAAPKPKRPPHRPKETTPAGAKEKGRPGRKTMEELMSRYRAKLVSVVDACWEAREAESERWIGEGFIDRPSPKLFPDYDNVIAQPIDLRTIRANIDADKYSCSTELGADLELMLSNAREFNEDDAPIVADAAVLEGLIHGALKALGPMPLTSPKVLKERYGWSRTRTTGVGGTGSPRTPSASPAPAKAKASTAGLTPKDAAMEKQMWALFNAIKDYVDGRGRLLSRIFMKLPSKSEYPDYYEVIKKPIDVEKIGNRLACHLYLSLDSLVADFAVMFDNACRYNEPESIVYKDALTLQKVLLQKKSEIAALGGGGSTPNVQQAVQELLTTLFVELYNHQDSEGRCYSDSLAEVAALERAAEGDAKGLLTLDRVKRNLDKERYRRLDVFQDAILGVLEKARALSRSDSQLFEDAAELALFFLRQRDELCKRASGECLVSPALSLSEPRLRSLIDEERKAKAPSEQREDSERPADPREAPVGEKRDGDTALATLSVAPKEGVEEEVAVGHYVLVKPNDDKMEAHVLRVESMWREEESGEEFVAGRWFYRPYQTFHLATRKFLHQEVFKTNYKDKVVAGRILGRCLVMFVKKFIAFAPKGFPEDRVFVCESEYLGKVLHFKKLKAWPYGDEAELAERPEELTLSRSVPSVFLGGETADAVRKAADKEEEEEAEFEDKEDKDFSVINRTRQEVTVEVPGSEEGRTYLEQAKVGDGGWWVKLGDCVYARNDNKELPDVVRVDRIWRDKEGALSIAGPWFARPIEVEHEPSRLFLKREVFAVEGCADTVVRSQDVMGRCLVMNLKDFLAWRLTEVRETDVLVVQWKVPAATPAGQAPAASSLEDAASAAAQPLSPPPVPSSGTAGASSGLSSPGPISPTPSASGGQPMSESSARRIRQLKAYKHSREVVEDEVFYFGKPIRAEQEPSPLLMKTDSSVEAGDPGLMEVEGLPGDVRDMSSWLSTQPKLNSRSKSGYILFSAEVRRRIMAEHPDSTFGDVSKMVGVEWKKLNEEERKQFDVRAQVIAEERERADKAKGGKAGALQPGQIRVHVCRWKDCDFQFDASDALFDHITTAHTSQIVEGGENQFICLWVTCVKYRKEGKPFPSLPRLHRHIKEKHMPTAVKTLFPQQRSRNYCGATPPPTTPTPSSTPQPMPVGPPPPQPQFTPGPSQHFLPQHPHPPQPQPGYFGSPPGVHMQAGPPMPQPPQPQVHAPPQGHPTQQVIIDQHGQVVQAYPSAMVAGAGQAGGGVAPGPVLAQPIPAPPLVQQPGTSQPQADPSKILVERSEPVFVPAPGSARVTRLLHSETYLRYIESLGSGQRHQSRWDRSLGANAQNTPLPPNAAPPGEMLGLPPGTPKEDVTKALWNLRTALLHDSLNITRVLKATDY